jgi:hypothetical protein
LMTKIVESTEMVVQINYLTNRLRPKTRA